jgi:hypothetical protein
LTYIVELLGIRHRRRRRRVDAVRVWQEAERVQAAEHDSAVRRLLEEAATRRDERAVRTMRE